MTGMTNHITDSPNGSSIDHAITSGFARGNDDVQLYWRAVGNGPLITCCNGVGVSTFFWKYIVSHFSDRYTVIVWDYRGHGHSERRLDPHTEDMSVVRHADDLAAVLVDARASLGLAKSAPSVLIGHSMGCQVALEARRRHPEDVAGLILMLGTAGKTLSTFFDNPRSPMFFRAAHHALFKAGPRANGVLRFLLESPAAFRFATTFSLVDPFYTRKTDFVPYLEHLATLDFRLFIETVCQTNDHDAWDLLPHLDRPLLVIAAENDKFTPMWCSEKIVSDTPGAEMLVLADGSHAALIEQPDTINHRIDRFIRERFPPVW